MPRFHDPDDPALAARLAECRARFATSLVGAWRTVGGTFDAVRFARWEFRADGTASVTHHGALGGEVEREVYRWEQCGPFRIRIGEIDDDSSEILWAPPLTYEISAFEHDAGTEIVLHEAGKDGFWLEDVPLRPE